jgi:hypothetical protein
LRVANEEQLPVEKKEGHPFREGGARRACGFFLFRQPKNEGGSGGGKKLRAPLLLPVWRDGCALPPWTAKMTLRRTRRRARCALRGQHTRVLYLPFRARCRCYGLARADAAAVDLRARRSGRWL